MKDKEYEEFINSLKELQRKANEILENLNEYREIKAPNIDDDEILIKSKESYISPEIDLWLDRQDYQENQFEKQDAVDLLILKVRREIFKEEEMSINFNTKPSGLDDYTLFILVTYLLSEIKKTTNTDEVLNTVELVKEDKRPMFEIFRELINIYGA